MLKIKSITIQRVFIRYIDKKDRKPLKIHDQYFKKYFFKYFLYIPQNTKKQKIQKTASKYSKIARLTAFYKIILYHYLTR